MVRVGFLEMIEMDRLFDTYGYNLSSYRLEFERGEDRLAVQVDHRGLQDPLLQDR